MKYSRPYQKAENLKNVIMILIIVKIFLNTLNEPKKDS